MTVNRARHPHASRVRRWPAWTLALAVHALWFAPQPSLQLTDFADWSQVARWASQLFAGERTHSPALAQAIERWRALPDQSRRAEAALAFVRDEVRYFGMEL